MDRTMQSEEIEAFMCPPAMGRTQKHWCVTMQWEATKGCTIAHGRDQKNGCVVMHVEPSPRMGTCAWCMESNRVCVPARVRQDTSTVVRSAGSTDRGKKRARGMAATRAAYRGLLRATKEAFRGDPSMLEAARNEVRHKFEANRQLVDPQQIEKEQRDAWEAASFVRNCIAQAQLNERGNYELHVKPQHVDGVAESTIQPSEREEEEEERPREPKPAPHH